jgi:pimeloyl-ACP methyl ester carboxylesterase
MGFRTRSWLILKGILFLLAALLLVLLLLVAMPLGLNLTLPTPDPAMNFHAAKAAIEGKLEGLSSTFSVEGRPRAFLHDEPTENVFVLLHGLTNTPEQFDKLGHILYERGHNVLLPVMPGHGKADRMTDALGEFTVQGMMNPANQTASIARVLGRRVTIVGLSVNGTAAAWMAQTRADVDRVVLLAPFLSPHGLPPWARVPVTRLLVRMPNAFLWWDPVHQKDLPGPSHAYPRFSTRSIGATMLLGIHVLEESVKSAPMCGSILVVTTASDFAADNASTAQLVANWRRHRPESIETFESPESDNVPHDFIDPNQPNQQVELVYPQLINMLEKPFIN